MTMIGRRAMLGGIALAAGLAAERAEACTIAARLKPKPFSDAAVRASLNALVSLIAAAPKLADAEITKRAEAIGVEIDEGTIEELLNYRNAVRPEPPELFRTWSINAGKPDRSPIRLSEVNLLKEAKGVALYQFTLVRDQFHAADAEGCNGMGTHGEFFGPEARSYMGVFLNNQLREMNAFPDWLRKL